VKIERPMLAATVAYDDLEKVEWPVLCSPKIDGIRCLIHPELGPVTRSFKPLPNEHVRERLLIYAGHSYLDGELVSVDNKGTILTFNQTQSAMMSHNGQPLFVFMVFDCFDRPDWDFGSRHLQAKETCKKINKPEIQLLVHKVAHNMEDFIKFTDACIEAGFEGAIIRAPAGIYKSGRSTLKQGWLLKYKQWADAEGTVIGFEELMHNDNPDKRDKFDLAKRSSHKDNMVPAGTLGALVLDTAWGELRIGVGFDQATRQAIWNRNEVKNLGGGITIHDMPQPDIGKTVTFKYQPHGMQDLPRFPVFLRFRDSE